MNKLFLTLGGKGGVGKSLTISLIADFLEQSGISFRAFDCDSENVGKASAFSTAYKPAHSINLRSIKDCDYLLTEASKSEISLVDLPANASGDFLEWWDSVATPETLESLNIEVVGIGVLTPEAGSFASVAQWAEKLQGKLKYIIALNHRILRRAVATREELFFEYFHSKTGKAFQKAFQPKEFEVPSLYEGSMIHLAKAKQLPSKALSDSSIPILDRSRIRTWITKIHSQLEGLL